MIETVDRIGIVIPVHNEQRLLPALLSSVVDAASACELPVRIVVVLDDCTDHSRRRAEAFLSDLPYRVSIEIAQIRARRVGAARRAGAALLMDAALAARTALTNLWIANTDADCRVPREWLAHQLHHAGQGADAVAGTIAVEDWSPRAPALRIAAERAYRSGPRRHVHGANLGVRASAYQRAGGFRPSRSGEDVQLVERLQHTGASVAWAADLPVVTSARRTARAPSGFAAYLNRLEHRMAITPAPADPAPRAPDQGAAARRPPGWSVHTALQD